MYLIQEYNTFGFGRLASQIQHQSFDRAKDAAEALKVKTGKTYIIVKAEVVWSTKTLGTGAVGA